MPQLPPSLQKYADGDRAVQPLADFVAEIAAEACRLQRQSDRERFGDERAYSLDGPLVVVIE